MALMVINYEGGKLRPIEERADAFEALEADINNLYAKAVALIDELDRPVPQPTPPETTSNCGRECEHDGGRLQNLFVRFLNHSSTAIYRVKTYEHAYWASDNDGSEGEQPLSPSILKQYYVTVGYKICAASMDSGCTTTKFDHSDGFVSQMPSTARLKVKGC